MAPHISTISASEAIAAIKSGDRVYIGSNCGQPVTLTEALYEARNDLFGVDICHLLTAGPAPYVGQDLLDHFRHRAFFIGGNVRKAAAEGLVDYLPIFLSQIPGLFKNGQLPLDVAMVSVTPPDEHGFCSLGVSVDIGLAACRNARLVIAEIQPEMPRTLGDSFLHVSEIDLFVDAKYPLLKHQAEEPDEVSRDIARYIAGLIEDGSTLQTGIGKIPDSVFELLQDKNDLGIHTEMFSDGLIRAMEHGNINGSAKNLHQGKAVATFCLGSKMAYRAIDNNPFFEFRPTEYVNDPYIIGQHDRMVGINSAIEVDLTGQVVSDSIGTRFFSGIGGQVDFIRGSARSRGGKPIIAIPSTAKGDQFSRIVPMIRPGAGVVTSRGDVHYVITEYGVAYLHGKTIRERALELIRISHPKFRDELLEKAKELGYVPKEQPSLDFNYPDEFVRDLTLASGEDVRVRPIRPSDERLLTHHFYSLSQESVMMRFGEAVRSLSHAKIRDLVNVDYINHYAILGMQKVGEGFEPVGVARYYVNQSTGIAELAMAVVDEFQNKGMGTTLLAALIERAKATRLNGLEAYVAADNHAMLKLLYGCGLPHQLTRSDGQIHIVLDLRPARAPKPE